MKYNTLDTKDTQDINLSRHNSEK